MVILGIDPGTAITGFGVIDYKGTSFRTLGYGCIRTAASDDVSTRLQQIHTRVTEIVTAHVPDAIAIEKLFFNKNVNSALAVGQARGVVILAAAQHGVPVFEYTPTAVKLGVTGQGRANKAQVGFMIRALLNLTDMPKPDDVTDALAVAICHAHQGGGKAWQTWEAGEKR